MLYHIPATQIKNYDTLLTRAQWGNSKIDTLLFTQLILLNDTNMDQRRTKLRRWFFGGGVLFASYQMFQLMALGTRLKRQTGDSTRYLLDPGLIALIYHNNH